MRRDEDEVEAVGPELGRLQELFHVATRRWSVDGRGLARARVARGLSQRELAGLAGVSHTYVSRMEGGGVIVTTAMRRRIINALARQP
jgi:DNA-binding XRE family transcriptional regulator